MRQPRPPRPDRCVKGSAPVAGRMVWSSQRGVGGIQATEPERGLLSSWCGVCWRTRPLPIISQGSRASRPLVVAIFDDASIQEPNLLAKSQSQCDWKRPWSPASVAEPRLFCSGLLRRPTPLQVALEDGGGGGLAA